MQYDDSSPTHPLDIYFRHNLWANLLLFDACLGLDEAQLEFSAKGTFGSIKSTLGHIVFAEERYIFHITSGKQSAETPRPTPTTLLAELRTRVEPSSVSIEQSTRPPAPVSRSSRTRQRPSSAGNSAAPDPTLHGRIDVATHCERNSQRRSPAYSIALRSSVSEYPSPE